MVFNSFTFLLFFVCCLLVYFTMPDKYRKYFLLPVSYFFYMFWKWEYGLLLLLSTALQYFAALYIEKYRTSNPTKAKWFLYLGVGSDLSMLFFFKYFNFFSENVSTLASYFGWENNWVAWNIVLPIGISFYVFQTMSYTIDVYRGKMKAEKDFTLFALYVSFFPQLVAGPIERASALLPQFHKPTEITEDKIIAGIKLIIVGFLKKMVLADNMALFVDKVYATGYEASGVEYILATWAFIFQVYGDFSGYSDIAIGVASMMGFELMKNFNHPFCATTVSEFWQRWHISLSSWVKDYIYIPLGGNRFGEFRTYTHLFISLFIIGIWHGARWTIFWYAGVNGISIVISRWFLKQNYKLKVMPWEKVDVWFQRFFVLQIICLSLVFFRSQTVDQALGVFVNIYTDVMHGVFFVLPSGLPKVATFFLMLVLFRDYYIEFNLFQSMRNNIWLKSIWYSILVLCVIVFGIFESSQFVYFQF